MTNLPFSKHKENTVTCERDPNQGDRIFITHKFSMIEKEGSEKNQKIAQNHHRSEWSA